MSAGAAAISHIRFAEGSASCYFYTDTDPSTAVCTQCPSGQTAFSPRDDASSCRACMESGETFSETTKGCICAAGYTEGGAGCVSCATGTYKTAVGSGSCTSCPSATSSASASTALENCTCTAGYTAASDGVACTGCGAGTYKPSTGSSSCISCPLGTSSASASTALNTCTCKTGHAATLDGVTCAACGAGTYKTGTGTGECEQCTEGKYTTATGSGLCTSCPSATNSALGSTALDDCTCNAGYTAASDGVPCTGCGVGTYKTAIGSGLCTSCPNRTNSASGSTAIEDCTCNAGYTAAPDGVACTGCGAGKYKTNPGSAACGMCAAGTFKEVTGPGVCHTCPPRTNSDEGAAECLDTYCAGGYYWSEIDSCDECPKNTYCTNGTQTACPEHSLSNIASNALSDCTCANGYTNIPP
jgi:hypothetical protein